jgi:hypothetical protein
MIRMIVESIDSKIRFFGASETQKKAILKEERDREHTPPSKHSYTYKTHIKNQLKFTFYT